MKWVLAAWAGTFIVAVAYLAWEFRRAEVDDSPDPDDPWWATDAWWVRQLPEIDDEERNAGP